MKARLRHEILTGFSIALATFLLVGFTWYGIHESRKAALQSISAADKAQKIRDEFQVKLFYTESFSSTFNQMMMYLSLLRINTVHLWDNAKHYKGEDLSKRMLTLNDKRGSNLAYVVAAGNNFLRLYKKNKINPVLSQRLSSKLRCVIQWNEALYIRILEGKYQNYNFTTPLCEKNKLKYPKHHCFTPIINRRDFLTWGICINDSITDYEITTGT